MTSAKLFKFHKISTQHMFLPSFSLIWLELEKSFEKFAILIMF